MSTLHYASGNVGNQGFDPAAGAVGFNLADVQDAETLNALPAGVQGLYYLDEAKGVTPSFVAQMNAIKGNPKLFGVYLADEPDPSNVKAADLKSESDWIHANMPGVKTFIVADFQGDDSNPNYAAQGYTAANTHVDLWGIDAYPVKGSGSPNYGEIDTAVHNAEQQIGISAAQIVPVYQAFGGGFGGGPWTLPTAAQEKAIIAEYAKVVPDPVFDYAYSWMQQEGDTPLSQAPALQQVFKDYFAAGGSTTPTSTQTPTSTPTSTSTPTPTSTSTPTPDPTHTIIGDNSANKLVGTNGDDVLIGKGGKDVLVGSGGSDTLEGDAGNDTFVFNALHAGDVTHIRDFGTTRGDMDVIKLAHSAFGAIHTGELTQAAFKDLGVAGSHVDSSDRIIYDHNAGSLSYDPDGSGPKAAVQFAVIDNHAHLTSADFLIA